MDNTKIAATSAAILTAFIALTAVISGMSNEDITIKDKQQYIEQRDLLFNKVEKKEVLTHKEYQALIGNLKMEVERLGGVELRGVRGNILTKLSQKIKKDGIK